MTGLSTSDVSSGTASTSAPPGASTSLERCAARASSSTAANRDPATSRLSVEIGEREDPDVGGRVEGRGCAARPQPEITGPTVGMIAARRRRRRRPGATIGCTRAGTRLAGEAGHSIRAQASRTASGPPGRWRTRRRPSWPSDRVLAAFSTTGYPIAVGGVTASSTVSDHLGGERGRAPPRRAAPASPARPGRGAGAEIGSGHQPSRTAATRPASRPQTAALWLASHAA